MIAIYSIIVYLVNSPVFSLICSTIGLIGFGLTFYVFIKTQNIDQRLMQLQIKQRYNENRKAYHIKLNAYSQNLLDDNVAQRSFFKSILGTVSEIQANYSDILSLKDKITIFRLKRQLKKEPSEININKVANDLAELSARLTKQEAEKL